MHQDSRKHECQVGVDELNTFKGKLICCRYPIGFSGNLGDDLTGSHWTLIGDISAALELGLGMGMAPFLTVHFAGQRLVGRNIVVVTGSVLNPNMELLFQGPLHP